MKKYISNIIVGIGSVCCFAAAAYMAINGQTADSWGWFLFVGILAGYYAVN